MSDEVDRVLGNAQKTDPKTWVRTRQHLAATHSSAAGVQAKVAVPDISSGQTRRSAPSARRRMSSIAAALPSRSPTRWFICAKAMVSLSAMQAI